MDALAASLPVASPLLIAFLAVAVAEIGDKSQLVCMMLATRGSAWMVFLGAGSAFAVLNLLAVWVGSQLAGLIPDTVAGVAVAALFAWFGIRLLLDTPSDEEEAAPLTDGSVFRVSAMSIMVAEFGDKTQLAVAGLSIEYPPVPVWLGATAALLTLTGIAVVLGAGLIRRLPVVTIHRAGGILFLLIALSVAVQTWLGQ
jgi:putative Ca2+/H+ antiporter (TMEM165/GDT1 family)